MKAVLISIQPKWCELIASGKKMVEVRKTKPKIEMPFKCYIYCTQNGKNLIKDDISTTISFIAKNSGKVIGEFVCDRIDDFYCASIPYRKENNLGYGYFVDNGVYKVDGWHEGVVFERSGPRIDTMLKNTDLENMCLSAQQIFDYIGIGKHLYAWHISDLVIYDKPKELSEFWSADKCPYASKDGCTYKYHCFRAGQTKRCGDTLTRPPQSYMYVEELR